jgi:hypothetical protein
MKTKTMEFINTYEKGKIVFFSEVDFDFTKYNTLIKVTIDNKKNYKFYLENEIIKNNQVQKSVFELPIVGKFIYIEVEANFDLDSIRIELV